ncbi:MAG: glycerate kinase type-2 family protein [Nitrospiraceae bacterium]
MSQPRPRAIFTRLFKAGLRAVDPHASILQQVTIRKNHLVVGGARYRLAEYRRIVAVGAGKASARMAQGLEHVLGHCLETGLVVTKYGHAAPTKTIHVVEAGHPVPDQAGLQASQRLQALVHGLTRHDLLIVLLSGGASSLLPAPVPGLSLEDKQKTTQLLLKSGATIQEMNAVRKHLSTLKGGQLAALTQARVLTLILSDVIGNDLGTIGSGPTAPDDTTFRDAWTIIQKYRLGASVPVAVRRHLLLGLRRKVRETPTSGSPIFKRVQHHLLGNNEAAVETAARTAVHEGLRTMVITSTLTGEAKEVAKVFGAMARELVSRERPLRRPCCLVAGGELTVTVRGGGRGGRAQEFALAAALEIQGLRNVWIAGFATDGSDGPTDVAGAIVDGGTVARARRERQRPERALLENNAYDFFRKVGGHIMTGPTGTNVNDLYLLLVL